MHNPHFSEHRLRRSLLVAPMFLLLAHCRGNAAPAAFIPASEGLRPEHRGQSPVLEKVACPPGTDRCEAMRVYPDGAVYLQDSQNPSAPVWAYLTKLREAGITSLHETFDELCDVRAEPERNANDAGSVTYRWATGRCSREVVITGVSYGHGYASLQLVTNIVNSNLMPRAAGE